MEQVDHVAGGDEVTTPKKQQEQVEAESGNPAILGESRVSVSRQGQQ